MYAAKGRIRAKNKIIIIPFIPRPAMLTCRAGIFPRRNKLRIDRNNFCLLSEQKLFLTHSTVPPLPKMFFAEKHFGAPVYWHKEG